MHGVKASRLLVILDIRVDEIGHVVAVLFLFFKEGVVGGVILDFDVVGDHHRVFFFLCRSVIERNDFGANGLDVRFIVHDGGGCARRSARRDGGGYKRSAAFGAKDGIAIKIKKFSAAALALALAAEIGFGHVTSSLKANAAIIVS